MMGQLVMRKALPFLSAIALAVAGFAGQASAQACNTIVGTQGDGVPTNITVNTTWGGGANPSPICLEEPIFVKSGATLTILPGTVVRGQPRRAVAGTVDGTPGALVITRSGKLISDGTANNPIIFTTAAVDNNGDGTCDDGNGDGFFDPWPGYNGAIAANGPDATPTFCDPNPKTNPLEPLMANGVAAIKLWGGVMLLGRAPTNLANQQATPLGHGTGFVEGLAIPGFNPTDGTCGGLEPHDSSGIVRYTEVMHGGDELASSNEINGFTLCAVGDNTIFEFNEVYANYDDAFELFGGTVAVNHLVAEYVGDDMYDVDWGYTGSMQFLLGIKPFFKNDGGAIYGQAGGDKFVEADGGDYEQEPGNGNFNINTRTAYSNAVYPADPRALVPASTDTAGWPFPAFYIANYTGIGNIPDGGSNPNPPVAAAAATAGAQWRRGAAGQVVNSLFVNNGAQPCVKVDTSVNQSTTGYDEADILNKDLARVIATSCRDTGPLAAAEIQLGTNGDNFANFDTQNGACGGGLNYHNDLTGATFTGLVQENPKFNGKVWTAGPAYDPRPAGAGANCGITPRLPGLDRAATYRGAFPPGQPLWTDGWTVLNHVGLL